jgi:hypothetical protein
MAVVFNTGSSLPGGADDVENDCVLGVDDDVEDDCVGGGADEAGGADDTRA